jgi:hypothetical protein
MRTLQNRLNLWKDLFNTFYSNGFERENSYC